MKPKQFHAFTGYALGLSNVLTSKVGIAQAHDPSRDSSTPPEPVIFEAIWDTGATNTVITESLATKLNLKPTGKINTHNAAGTEIRNRYLVNLFLPNNVNFPYMNVTDCKELTGGFEVLIGMDIIGAGDFAVTNSNGKTVMSYRYPSIERIDFVEMANEQNARLILKKAPDGRYLVSKKHKRVNKKKAERNNRRQGRKAKKH